MYTVAISNTIRRSLKRLPQQLRDRLLGAAYTLADEPRPHGTTKLAGGQNLYRIRVGDYRIVYEIDDEMHQVKVTIIAHRREVYRGI
ncbi:MAG TPA: type II toxin-antitoxin system RelE/ParE family toxin [Tepidisphaeraceae bacterium]|jgi:mRNA interferase RelE/StbE